MGIYIFQLIFLFGSSAVINNSKADFRQKRKRILAINLFLLWLVCAMKAPSVGIDIDGYKRVYEASAQWEWFDFSQVYYEEGYTVLMQLFSKLGADFQLFNAFVYTVIYVPWFVFLNRYTRQPTMSLLIYICYQFWVFNMSGLRQGMAMSICLMAFIILEKKSLRRIILFVVVVLAASTIHRSAIIFLVALGVYLFSVKISTLLLFCVSYLLAIVFRPTVVSAVNSIAGKYQVSETITLGGSFVMLVGFTCFCFYIVYRVEASRKDTHKVRLVNVNISHAAVYMMLCSIALYLVLNGSNMLRGASYASMFLTIALPNSTTACTWKSKVYVNCAVSVFLLVLYFSDVLLANQLNIIPYKVF